MSRIPIPAATQSLSFFSSATGQSLPRKIPLPTQNPQTNQGFKHPKSRSPITFKLHLRNSDKILRWYFHANLEIASEVFIA